MIDTLQPSSLIPYRNDSPKIEAANKPAVVISITTETKTGILKPNEASDPEFLSPAEWTMPVQEEGYIKGKGGDFL